MPDDPADLTAWADGEWVSRTGRYTFSVGTSSAETPLEKTIGVPFPRGQVEPALLPLSGREGLVVCTLC
ncbi:MAG TPA: hypothetical protein VIK95_05060 [Egibacteraceae bacterium]